MHNVVIFIFDHNPVHRNIVQYQLSRAGFSRIHICRTTEECFYRLEKELIPDFLIVDMPAIAETGAGLIRRVKTFDSGIRIIFFTENDETEVAGQIMEAGADDYILKSKDLAHGIKELASNIRYLSMELSKS